MLLIEIKYTIVYQVFSVFAHELLTVNKTNRRYAFKKKISWGGNDIVEGRFAEFLLVKIYFKSKKKTHLFVLKLI